MKKALILLLALTLTLALCGCGEDEKTTDATTATSGKPIETTVSTTVTEAEPTAGDGTTVTTESTTADPTATDPTGSRTVVTKPTTTTAIPSTVRTLPTKPTTTKAPTTTTKAPTTTTTVAVEQPIDPSGLVQGVEYWSNDYRVDGTSLTFTALMFDGDYCVVIDRQFTSAPEIAEGTTIEYGGKTYYSEGGGMNPVQFTVSGTELLLTNGGKLALYRDGTVRVLDAGNDLKRGMVFTLQPQ